VLRQRAATAAHQRDLAICGFDNGRPMAVTLGAGAVAWEVAVGQAQRPPRSALIDVDAPVVSDGDDLFAVGYQGVVRPRDSGSLWRATCRATASPSPRTRYATGSEGDVAPDRRTGARSGVKVLARRGLSRRRWSATPWSSATRRHRTGSTPATGLLARARPDASVPPQVQRRWPGAVFDDDGGERFAPRGDEVAMLPIVAIAAARMSASRRCSTG
jgi:hypothetical protein